MNTHTRMSLPALALAGAMVWGTPAGLAQSSAAAVPPDRDHSAHHPGASAGATSSMPAPGAASKETGGMPMGKMGKGGPAGMMGGDMKQMMPMMRDMMTMMSAQTGMITAHVEGRIASLKTELKITDAQTPQWNRFADALRDTAKSMNGMHEQMMASGSPATLPEQLDRHEKMMSAHLASLGALKEALTPLYQSFSDEQKKTADGLMVGPMGMM
jgi:hypothetical protein